MSLYEELRRNLAVYRAITGTETSVDPAGMGGNLERITPSLSANAAGEAGGEASAHAPQANTAGIAETRESAQAYSLTRPHAEIAEMPSAQRMAFPDSVQYPESSAKEAKATEYDDDLVMGAVLRKLEREARLSPQPAGEGGTP